MKFKELLQRFDLKLKINAWFLSAEVSYSDHDRKAAWDMYVELLTRITTQFLEPEHGDEKTALKSIYDLFGLTREILKKNGPGCNSFARIAIPILNQVIRPFTAKWHRKLVENAFEQADVRSNFRKELNELQIEIRKYTHLLSDMAGVEDMVDLEKDI